MKKVVHFFCISGLLIPSVNIFASGFYEEKLLISLEYSDYLNPVPFEIVELEVRYRNSDFHNVCYAAVNNGGFDYRCEDIMDGSKLVKILEKNCAGRYLPTLRRLAPKFADIQINGMGEKLPRTQIHDEEDNSLHIQFYSEEHAEKLERSGSPSGSNNGWDIGGDDNW